MSCTLEKGLQRVSLVSNLCPRPPGLLCPGTSLVPLPDGVQEDVDQNDEKREYKAEEEPYIDYLDGGGCRQAVGHRDVEGRQDHHAGDVHRNDRLQELRVGEVVSRLIDDVHEDRRQVSHDENAWKVSAQLDLHPDQLRVVAIDVTKNIVIDIVNIILTNTEGTAVVNSEECLVKYLIV